MARIEPFHLSDHDPTDWDWERLLAFCHAVARRQTDRPDVAEDAAQEAVARAWRARAACRHRADPRAWVAVIVRREVLRILAGGRARAEVPVDRVPELAAECEGLAAAEDRSTLDAALATLPPGDRRVLLLRYGEDMTQPAIARALDVPEGTVKVRLHRARARLRGAIEPVGGAARPRGAAARAGRV